MTSYDKYRRLRVLPFRERWAARERLERGEPLFAAGALARRTVDPFSEWKKDRERVEEEKAKREENARQQNEPPPPPEDEPVTVVPEPVRKLHAAYELLNLPQTGVTLKRAKKAYHKAAQKAHPDVGGSDEEFKKVKEAYDLVVSFLKG
jgi:hypothetical protein